MKMNVSFSSLALLILLRASDARLNEGQTENVVESETKVNEQSWQDYMSWDDTVTNSPEKYQDWLDSKMDHTFLDQKLSNLNKQSHLQTLKGHSMNEKNSLLPFEKVREDFRKATLENVDSILLGSEEDVANRRKTQAKDDTWEPIRIKFVTNDLENMQSSGPENLFLGPSGRDTTIKFLLNDVIPKANQFYTDLLKVKPFPHSISLSENICSGDVDEFPNGMLENGVEDADLVIFAKGISCRASTIAAATPCLMSRYDFRPIVGIIYFCLDNRGLDSNTVNSALDVTIHEIGHVLGMNSDLFSYFHDPETGSPYKPNMRTQKAESMECADGQSRSVLKPSERVMQQRKTEAGTTYYEMVTPKVVQVVRNQFDCQNMTGARLENQPSSPDKCFEAHWDERYFMTENMGTVYQFSLSAFSSLSLALLEDSGWYKGDYSMTNKSTFGHGAGCGFVQEDCIVDGGEIPSYSKGFFCNTPSSMSQSHIAYTCTATHSSIGYCDLFDFNLDPFSLSLLPPLEYKYFDQMLFPAFFSRADFCPTSMKIDQLDCRVYPDGSLAVDGLCVDLDFGNTGVQNSVQCANFQCDESLHRLEIKVPGSDDFLTCEHDFQMLDHPVFATTKIQCPRLAVICPDFVCPANCSGKGVCDYSAFPPKCNCFDSEDTSARCSKSSLFEEEIVNEGEEILTEEAEDEVSIEAFEDEISDEEKSTEEEFEEEIEEEFEEEIEEEIEEEKPKPPSSLFFP